MYVHVFTQMGHGDGPWPNNSKANGLRKIITQSNGTIGWPLAREFSFKRNFPKNLRSKWNGCKEMGKTFPQDSSCVEAASGSRGGFTRRPERLRLRLRVAAARCAASCSSSSRVASSTDIMLNCTLCLMLCRGWKYACMVPGRGGGGATSATLAFLGAGEWDSSSCEWDSWRVSCRRHMLMRSC